MVVYGDRAELLIYDQWHGFEMNMKDMFNDRRMQRLGHDHWLGEALCLRNQRSNQPENWCAALNC